MTKNRRTPEELKRELDRLNSEQHKDLSDAIYLGMPPEKAKRMDERCARIRSISEELYAFVRQSGE